ncbi:amidohydrolase 2, partial [Lentinus brumalis]
RIDIHHHIFPASIGKAALSVRMGWETPKENLPWSPQVSLRAMDQLSVKTAVLSFPAGIPGGPVGEPNRREAREFNQLASRICAEYPGRFAFFACMPNLLDVEGALAEMTFALDELGACGVSLSSSYGEGVDARYIGDDVFDPIWEALDMRSAVVFLHGAQIPSSTPYPHPFLGIPVVEVPNETFKAAAHLVVTGKKRRFPNANIILAHLGGSTPFLAARVAALSRHMGCPLTHEEILEDFKSFYFDTALSSHATTLAAMKSFVGGDRILFGTDFPAVTPSMAAWYKKQLEQFYADKPDRLQEIMSGNALKLMPELANMSS